MTLTGNNNAAPATLEFGSTGTVRLSSDANFTGGVALLAAGTFAPQASTTFTKNFQIVTSGTIDTGANNVTMSGRCSRSRCLVFPDLPASTSSARETSHLPAHTAFVANYSVANGQMIFAAAQRRGAERRQFLRRRQYQTRTRQHDAERRPHPQ